MGGNGARLDFPDQERRRRFPAVDARSAVEDFDIETLSCRMQSCGDDRVAFA